MSGRLRCTEEFNRYAVDKVTDRGYWMLYELRRRYSLFSFMPKIKRMQRIV